jgi:acyl carrier protein
MMTKEQEIFTFVKKMLLNFLDVDESEITPGSEIAALKLESLDYIEIQVELEKNYGVKVKPNVFAEGEIKTLAQFTDHIQSLLAKAA